LFTERLTKHNRRLIPTVYRELAASGDPQAVAQANQHAQLQALASQFAASGNPQLSDKEMAALIAQYQSLAAAGNPLPADSKTINDGAPEERRVCASCEDLPVAVQCRECDLGYCKGCDEETHKEGKNALHSRTRLHAPAKIAKAAFSLTE